MGTYNYDDSHCLQQPRCSGALRHTPAASLRRLGHRIRLSTHASVQHILSRYEKSCLEAGERAAKAAGQDVCKRFRTCQELLQMVDRLVDGNNTEKLSVTEMMQLELELDDALVQTRLRKTQLMMEYISTLQEEQRKLSEQKEEIKKQVASAAKQNDGGGGPNDIATNQMMMNSHQLVVTLPLFNG